MMSAMNSYICFHDDHLNIINLINTASAVKNIEWSAHDELMHVISTSEHHVMKWMYDSGRGENYDDRIGSYFKCGHAVESQSKIVYMVSWCMHSSHTT